MSDMFMQKPSQVITNTIQYTEYNLYLHGKIGDPDDFMEHFSVFKMAGEGDVIRLYITSEGGSLSTGMEYIRHMRECRAPIIGVLGVEVASMASAIALEADEIEVDEMTTMLIHSFSYGAMGSEASIYNQATFNNKLNERWIRKHYSDFLDDNQLSDVFKGVDILLDSDQIVERWESMQEARNEQGCGNADCESCGVDPQDEQEQFSLEDMIAEVSTKAVDQALAKLTKKFDLVPKAPKPKTSKKVVDKSVEEA